MALISDKPVGFIGVIHFPHPHTKNYKRVSRIVVLPDYQGIGIGTILLNTVGRYYAEQGYRFTIITSNPALNYSLKNQKGWKLTRQGRVGKQGKTGNQAFVKSNSRERITFTWEFDPKRVA